MISFALIGTGWRAAFYTRIARLAPEQFQVTAVLSRDPTRGEAFAQAEGVNVVCSLDELLDTHPSFVVVAAKRGCGLAWLYELIRRQVPVLIETPPTDDLEELPRLWQEVTARNARVQVAEQYFLQPLYAAWYALVRSGVLGRVENLDLSALHGYHAVSILRLMLGVGFENCTIWGKRYPETVTVTDGRQGPVFHGETVTAARDRVALEFESGKTAFLNFCPQQYHSFIRTRQFTLRGERGEIDGLTVRYLLPDNTPVKQTIERVDAGMYNNRDWAHYGMMLGEKVLYRSPLPTARLNDDELAVASCLLGMEDYLRTGKAFYPLSDALQDTYLSLLITRSLEHPLEPIRSTAQPWSS